MGCRVKSGWAATVLVGGSRAEPVVLDVRRLELADPRVPGSYQPFHAAAGAAQTDQAVIGRLVALVGATTDKAVTALLEAYAAAGPVPRTLGLVVGSTTDPASVTHPHMRAHASEGHLFRRALEEAGRSHGLTVRVIRERDLHAAGSEELGVPPTKLRDRLVELGKPTGGPWRSEHKLAALAAWLLL